MKVLIYEKNSEELSGHFVAEITEGRKNIKMYYDLSKQEDTYDGYYTDKAVLFLHPAPMSFNFNVEYNMPDDFDKMVAYFAENGWTVK
jgi:aspartate carbamoyltransferase catalytic subunit